MKQQKKWRKQKKKREVPSPKITDYEAHYIEKLGQEIYDYRCAFLGKLLDDHNCQFTRYSAKYFCKAKFEHCYDKRTSNEWKLSREESYQVSAQILLDMPKQGNNGIAIDLKKFQVLIMREHARQFHIHKRKYRNNNSFGSIIPRQTYKTEDIMPEHKITTEMPDAEMIANDLATALSNSNKLWADYLKLVWFNDPVIDSQDAQIKLGLSKMQFATMRKAMKERITRIYDDATNMLVDFI